MRRILVKALLPSVLAVALAALPPTAVAQEATLAEIIVVEPVTGHGAQFENGVRSHMEVLRSQDVPDAWMVWSIMTGENSGKYLVGTFNHTWADFDRMPADPDALQQSFRDHIEPHVDNAEVSFWRLRTDLSRIEVGAPPAAFSMLNHYMPDLGGGEDVVAVIRTIRESAEAQGWDQDWAVYQLVNGGEHPHLVVSIPGDRFADFEEPSPSMAEMLQAELGEADAGALFRRFTDAVRAESSEMIRWREDLSYVPEE